MRTLGFEVKKKKTQAHNIWFIQAEITELLMLTASKGKEIETFTLQKKKN